MPEQDPRDKLAELNARIAAAKAEKAPVKAHQDEHHSQAHLAWRMVTELVVGLGIGFGIGYGLDGLFGTRPFLMVVFIFLGLAAGIKTMLRSAKELQAEQAAQAPQDEREQDGD